MNKQYDRVVLGEQLKAIREKKYLTVYKVAKTGGIRIDQVKAVESGSKNYTIDIFLGYITGCGLNITITGKQDEE